MQQAYFSPLAWEQGLWHQHNSSARKATRGCNTARNYTWIDLTEQTLELVSSLKITQSKRCHVSWRKLVNIRCSTSRHPTQTSRGRSKSVRKGFTDKALYFINCLPRMVMLLCICCSIPLDPSLYLLAKYHCPWHWFIYVQGALTLLAAWKPHCGPATVMFTQWYSWKMVSKQLVNSCSSGL